MAVSAEHLPDSAKSKGGKQGMDTAAPIGDTTNGQLESQRIEKNLHQLSTGRTNGDPGAGHSPRNALLCTDL